MQGLTDQSEQLNDSLPTLCHHHGVCLAMWPLAGLAVIQGGGTMLSNPADLPTSCGRSWALLCLSLGVFPLPSTQRWDQESARAVSSPAAHGSSTILFLLLHCFSGIQFWSSLSLFPMCKPSCACSLFVSCFSLALCQPWWEAVAGSRAHSHHRAGPC